MPPRFFVWLPTLAQAWGPGPAAGPVGPARLGNLAVSLVISWASGYNIVIQVARYRFLK